jgi:hypothetical protein
VTRPSTAGKHFETAVKRRPEQPVERPTYVGLGHKYEWAVGAPHSSFTLNCGTSGLRITSRFRARSRDSRPFSVSVTVELPVTVRLCRN